MTLTKPAQRFAAPAIRAARKTDLVPILTERSYRLYPLPNGNFRILPDPDDPSRPYGIVVKQSFWIWHERDLAGNTIDFFMKIEGKSFQQAMQIIVADRHYDSSERKLREVRGNEAKTTQ